MELIDKFDSAAAARAGVTDMLERKVKIMGFGHAVYKESDPRNQVIKTWSKTLSEDSGDDALYAVSEAIDTLMWEKKHLFPNLDFYSASVYPVIGIPTHLFPPIFVCSRITGWVAHIMEQRANNKLIRPAAGYSGPDTRPYIALTERV